MNSIMAQQVDTNRLMRIAAEHVALETGLLFECPLHGEYYRRPLGNAELARTWSYEPLLPLFSDSAEELIAAARTVAACYGCECTHCASGAGQTRRRSQEHAIM